MPSAPISSPGGIVAPISALRITMSLGRKIPTSAAATSTCTGASTPANPSVMRASARNAYVPRITQSMTRLPSRSPRTPNMIRRDPKKNLKYAGGLEGGPNNPLGARAIYLYQNGNDTMFRIHGTNQPWSIGQAMSSGCVRMLNHDVIDLYERVKVGGRVHVIQGRRDA